MGHCFVRYKRKFTITEFDCINKIINKLILNRKKNPRTNFSERWSILKVYFDVRNMNCFTKGSFLPHIELQKNNRFDQSLESISSTFYTQIFCTKVCSKPNSRQRKAAQKTFIQKMHAKNVVEIGTWSK